MTVVSIGLCGSRVTRTVPAPLHVAEIKIHPSFELVNVNGWLAFEIEETASNSETKLFNFLSSLNGISGPAASAIPPIQIRNEATSRASITLSMVGLMEGCKTDGCQSSNRNRSRFRNRSSRAFTLTENSSLQNSELASGGSSG